MILFCSSFLDRKMMLLGGSQMHGFGLFPSAWSGYALPNITGGVNAGFSPQYRQQFNSFGPYNNFTYSPTLTRDFNRFTGNTYTYNPRLIDNYNHYHHTQFDYAPEYIQNYNFRPSVGFGYHPSFQQNFNQYPPVGGVRW